MVVKWFCRHDWKLNGSYVYRYHSDFTKETRTRFLYICRKCEKVKTTWKRGQWDVQIKQ